MRDAGCGAPHPASRIPHGAGCGLRDAESNEIALLGFHSIQLQIIDETLEDIGSESVSYERSFHRMVKAWMKQKKPQPTWLTFVEALEELNICKNLSAHLRSKYCKYSVAACLLVVFSIDLIS